MQSILESLGEKMTDAITTVPIENLLLDPENPRLPESVERDQQSMLDYIAETTSIEELMEAIAENDFFQGEPIIVVPDQKNKGKYTVVEGNRRLTAVKLLNDPAICSSPGTKMRAIAGEAKHKPVAVPVVVRKTRSEVLPYLGFRHVTGVKQWEPLAKARYIEQLFVLTDNKLQPKVRYTDIARAIGSRRDHIKRNLDALAVYKVIEDEEFYGIDKLNDQSIKFAVLSTAIADERIGYFVGTHSQDADGEYISTDPIVNSSKLNKKAISELTHWLYEKDKKGKTRVGESRNLRELSAVVANSKAIAAFRAGSHLSIAYQLTSDVSADFIGLLYQAEGLLTEASGMVATVQYEEDAYQVARRISDNIKLIGRELKQKNREEDDF